MTALPYLTSLARGALELTLLAALYALLRHAYHRWARLPEEAYEAPLLLAEVLKRPSCAAVLVAPALPLLPFARQLSWEALDGAGWARPFAGFLVAGASAFGATYAFNWYFGRLHLGDRALLVALAAATILHPLFAIPFVGLFLVLMHQFIVPVHPNDADDLNLYCHKVVYAHQLLALVAFLCASAVWRGVPGVRLAQLMLLVHGANYVASAIGKHRLRWTTRNELVGLVAAAVAHRWFEPRSRRTDLVTVVVRKSNVALLVGCIALEAGGGLLLLDRRVAIAVLVGLALFHVSVLALSGINFLPWAALDAALIGVVCVQPAVAFGLAPFIAAGVALALTMRWMKPYCLAWLDARLCTAFRLEGVGDDGAVHELAPDVFAPYDITVTNGKFRCALDEKVVTDAWAECSEPEVYDDFKGLRTADDVRALEERAGWSYYHPDFEERLRRFTSRFARGLNEGRLSHGRGYLARDWLAPNPAWGSLLGARLTAVRLRVVRVLYAGDVCSVIDDRVFREMAVPAGREAVPAIEHASRASGFNAG